ncbi:cytochrome P450 [Saccharomonospora sp.]|uniref:cytochrome P450 n=1 Tax=Saccharomonospora sp. TaxID=33913 RepID=UPI0026192088|nr:cytochrome P450 [Saccharomonospora sp.]
MTRSAGLGDTARVIGEALAPTIAGGVIRRRPRAMALIDRLGLDRAALRLFAGLRARYGPGPVLLRIPGRSIALLLEPEDVRRVLTSTPSPFSPAAREKRAALNHFEPHGVLATPMPERAPRRRYNEQVLESERPVHSLAERVREVVGEETRLLLEDTTELDWDRHARTWWRIVRRVVLGDHARDQDEVTDELTALRLRGNWAFLLPKAKRRRDAFQKRLNDHLDRAEPGSLAAVIAEHEPENSAVDPFGQVPQWLFAFDAAGMVVLRALALLATHPDQAAAARKESAVDDARAWAYIRACVLDTLRLWPTTPLLLRESTTATSWRGKQLPPETLFVVFATYFHRDAELVPFADTFTPEAWLDERARELPGLVPFSAGPARCPGENLVLLVASAMLVEFLRAGEYRLLAPKTLRSRSHARDRLPATVDNFGIRLAFTPHETRGSSA